MTGVTDSAVTFTVYGRPQPGGSKRHIPIRDGDGHPTGRAVIIDANPKVHDWRQEIRLAAIHANGNGRFMSGPLALSVRFYLKRPRGHHRTGARAAELRPSAPALPTTQPDATKLLRALEDALTGVLWRDDAQIVDQHASKRYGDPERVEVHIASIAEEGLL